MISNGDDIALFLDIWAGVNPFTVMVSVLLGSLLGSFLNVVIYRLPLDRSVVFPPSACTTCGTPLKAWHNIPVLSYFLLGGRCRTCSSPYSIRYALIELLLACSTAGLLVINGGFSWPFCYHFVLLFLSTAVFFTDLDHWIIPDQLNLMGVLVGVAGSYWMPSRHDLDFLEWAVPQGWDNVLSSSVGVVFGAGFFWIIQIFGLILARQEAMGGGDVKYAAAIGAFLGWQLSFVAFLLSFVLGAMLAIPMLLRSRGQGKDPIPFGTFMALAAVPTALWGTSMLSWFYRMPELLYGF